MEKHPYIIMAPPYRHNSAGVRALYELQRHLQEKGYPATICQVGRAPSDSIVVYPETVSGNPLGGKTVARLVLNSPGLLGGDEKYDPDELVFSYGREFYPEAPLLMVPVIEEFFRDEGHERTGGCFWVGKGFYVPRIPETEGLIEITPAWPETREELARLFNGVNVFYSYDDCTALTTEAGLCGCRVVVIPGEKPSTYLEDVKDFEEQLGYFIDITQAAAQKVKSGRISMGVMVNDPLRLDMVLKQSQIPKNIRCHRLDNPESATKGLNLLIERIEASGSDVAILAHQDMYFRRGWIEQVESQIAKLPDSWIVAGIIGKDANGIICGKFHDMRVPLDFDTSDIHEFPHPAICFDEAVLIINLKSGFRFDESLTGFDLYGTLCVLQAWEMGGTAWVIDAPAEHYCMRSFGWAPDALFIQNYKMLWDRFSERWPVDSTALGMSADPDEREVQKKAFMTSAAAYK